MKTHLALLFTTLTTAHALGCTWDTNLPADAASVHVDRSRELVVVDEAIVSGALGRNDSDGPLGFRHAMEGLGLGDGATLRWLAAWSRRLRDEGHAERAAAFDKKVTCAWLRRVATNACDDLCTSCAEQTLRLEDAPFRLIAIANRTDLSVLPDRAADGGEGRLVFALTDGPADDASATPLPVTVIFEYAQEGSAFAWATRWHALGQTSDAEFPAKLAELTQTFVAKGALAQLRTADAWTGSTLLLHQFERDAGELAASNVRNTLDFSQVPSSSIRDYADSHADAIKDGTHVLPRTWWASSSSPHEAMPSYVAELAQHDALVRGTCGGCHAESDNGFHIDPLAKGDQKLSRFLLDATKERDEIHRRIEWMQLTLSRGH